MMDSRQSGSSTPAVVDNCTRECLAIEVGQGIGVEKWPESWDGPPRNGVMLHFSLPGKPTGDAYAESFNGGLRGKCLNANGFLLVEGDWAKVVIWRHSIESRPHTVLGNMPSSESLTKVELTPPWWALRNPELSFPGRT